MYKVHTNPYSRSNCVCCHTCTYFNVSMFISFHTSCDTMNFRASRLFLNCILSLAFPCLSLGLGGAVGVYLMFKHFGFLLIGQCVQLALFPGHSQIYLATVEKNRFFSVYVCVRVRLCILVIIKSIDSSTEHIYLTPP